jgi:hypothetical protein
MVIVLIQDILKFEEPALNEKSVGLFLLIQFITAKKTIAFPWSI